MRRIIWSLSLAIFLLVAGPAARAQSIYEFDATKGKLELDVYKEGFFKAFGHDHLVAAKDFSGRVVFDAGKIETSSVTLRVAAKSLTVTDPGASEKDRKEVQATMHGEKVLDVARFPEIVFASARVTKAEKTTEGWRIILGGSLRLHGVQKNISLPVLLRIRGDELTALGEIFLLQTDYGITPTKAGGGAVRVKDRLRIRFEIHARALAKS
jgi:polyisoprenoid-binding protein YceI